MDTHWELVFGAPVLTALTSKMSRKITVDAIDGYFIVGNSVAALSTSFGLLLILRIQYCIFTRNFLFHRCDYRFR